MILIVSYDLKGAHNYAPFFEALRSQGVWWHYLASTWLIHTDKTPEQVYNAICGHIRRADRLFVGTLANGYEGWLPKDAWDWIEAKGLHHR